MPSRTLRVAVLMAATATARPALAEDRGECCRSSCEANPWRGQASANPWRGQMPYQPQRSLEVELRIPSLTWSYSYNGPEGTFTRTDPACEPAPAPRPTENRELFQYHIGMFGGDTAAPAPRPTPVTEVYAPPPVRETRTGQFIVSGAVNRNPPPCVPAATPPPLTIHDVVRISGRDPVTLAPVPTCHPLPTVSAGPGCCSPPATSTHPFTVALVAQPAGTKLHGTWVRELPGAVVGFTFADGELKAVAHVNMDGVRGTVTLTADYAVTKDGTVHGVITGADATGSGGDLGGLELVSVAVVAQMFVDQPFAFRVKPTGDGVMLSNIRFPLVEAMTQDPGPGPKMTGLLCGLYKPAKAGTLPTAKALKTSATAAPGEPSCDGLLDVLGGLFGRPTGVPACAAGGMTLPSPHYLQHFPQFFPPPPIGPPEVNGPAVNVTMPLPMPGSPMMLPPQACPLPPGVMPYPVGVAPVPPMHPPAPLPETPVPDKKKGKGKKKTQPQTYSADPNARIQELLNNSEDQRKLSEGWQRFWFNDQPSHLTPERFHGGIQ